VFKTPIDYNYISTRSKLIPATSWQKTSFWTRFIQRRVWTDLNFLVPPHRTAATDESQRPRLQPASSWPEDIFQKTDRALKICLPDPTKNFQQLDVKS